MTEIRDRCPGTPGWPSCCREHQPQRDVQLQLLCGVQNLTSRIVRMDRRSTAVHICARLEKDARQIARREYGPR